MKLLKISNTEKFALIDDEDYDRCLTLNWTVASGKGVDRVTIRTTAPYNKKWLQLTNFIMGTIGVLYDHEDRNPFNNQKLNLRQCTRSQNSRNIGKFDNCSSQYKGVSWNKERKYWVSYIKKGNLRKHIGYFDNEIDAAKAYDRVAKKFFKEFAYLNFPNETVKEVQNARP